MPNGYGYIKQGSFVNGGSQLIYNESNYVFGITYKLQTGSTTQYDGYIYKYDAVANTTTIFSGQLLPIDTTIPCNVTNYNNQLFFNYSFKLYKINLSTNSVSLIIPDSSNNFVIKNNRVYSFGGSNINGGNGNEFNLQVYDLNNSSLTIPVYTDVNTGLIYQYFFKTYGINGNDIYFHGFNYGGNGGFRKYRLYKLDESGNLSIVYDFNNESLGINNSLVVENAYKPVIPIVNNKLILGKTNGGIATFNTSTNLYNSNAYSANFYNGDNSFYANGWMYFLDNSDVVHKTDGSSFLQASFPIFFTYSSGGDEYRPIVAYNGNYYGSYNGVYKSDLSNSNTTLIYGGLNSMQYGKVSNNKLLFYNSQPNQITSYDGIEFNTLNLNFSPEILNKKMIQVGNSIFMNGFKYNGSYYDYGLYKIDISTLSLQENTMKPSIIFSPNPTNATIIFSTEISNLEVYDAMGKKVKYFENTNSEFDMSSLENGIYFLKIKTDNGIINQKFIKN